MSRQVTHKQRDTWFSRGRGRSGRLADEAAMARSRSLWLVEVSNLVRQGGRTLLVCPNNSVSQLQAKIRPRATNVRSHPSAA